MARKRKREAEEAGFAEQPSAAPSRERLTPVEIQQKVFRLAFRGYNERDVDEFLDHVTEDLAALHEENKRLRERLQEGGGGGGNLQAAQRQAEAIVRQAREHAARLVADAGGAASGVPAPAPYLVRERAFLQQVAALVQSHARTLKDEARKARRPGAEVSRPAETAAPPEPETAPEPEPRREAEPPEAEAAPTAEALVPDPTPAPDPAPAPEDPDSQRSSTAAWGPVEGPGGDAGWTEPGQPGDRDPLLSAWENAFLGGAEGGAAAEPAFENERREEKPEGGEPSLRELFWGEE